MCGICGAFSPNQNTIIDPTDILQIRNKMMMRGPDASDISSKHGCVLAHNRLAIIDLSSDGIQPMNNSHMSLEIVFNGEIYNYKELRHTLKQYGHEFSTQTDTEVLLHGYKHWGLSELLNRIRGMYAFALLDYDVWCIHLVRDITGQKPLFYHWSNNILYFASLASALNASENINLSINPNAIDDLLHNMAISGHHSIFNEVQKVKPGHFISVHKSGEIREECYWKPDFSKPEYNTDDETWINRVEAKLTSAVERRLISDVPLGVLVSGGVDSSLIAAIAQKISSKINSFSVALNNKSYDESMYSRIVAQHIKSNHHELTVQSDARQGLLALIAAMGEPFGDSSAINLYQITKLAKQHVTVILTGDGGDEGFGGYHSQMRYHYADQMAHWVPSVLNPLLQKFSASTSTGKGRLHGLGIVFKHATQPVSETFTGNCILDTQTKDLLYTAHFKSGIDNRDERFAIQAVDIQKCTTRVDKAMQIHFQTVLPDDYLSKVDYASMAVSMEARSPFLDRDLLELAFKIPAEARFRNFQAKSILRRLAYRYIPKEVIDRPKMGFVSPVWDWLANDWQDLVERYILGDNIERRGWFNRAYLESYFNNHQKNPTKYTGYILWTLLILELWILFHVDNELSIDSIL